MKINLCLSFISHASIYMPLELILLGSSDLLSIDPYDTLIQIHTCSNSWTWRNLFKKKKPCQLSCSNTTNATFIYESSALWFHIAILYILSLFKLAASRVMLCTFRTLIIHEHDTKHCPSVMTIIQNLVILLKQKRKAGSESSCSWFLVQKK